MRTVAVLNLDVGNVEDAAQSADASQYRFDCGSELLGQRRIGPPAVAAGHAKPVVPAIRRRNRGEREPGAYQTRLDVENRMRALIQRLAGVSGDPDHDVDATGSAFGQDTVLEIRRRPRPPKRRAKPVMVAHGVDLARAGELRPLHEPGGEGHQGIVAPALGAP